MDAGKRARYAKFEGQTYVPIFSKGYWLDAVCGDGWDAWFYQCGAEDFAAMPYVISQRGPYRIITRPDITQNNGIIFSKLDGQKVAKRESNEERIIGAAADFIDSLKLDLFEQQFHYSFRNWLPFFWRRYSAITRYTYVIETAGRRMEEIASEFHSQTRYEIKKALPAITIGEIDCETFYPYFVRVFEKKGIKPSIDFALCQRLAHACAENGNIRFFAARSEKGVEAVSCFVEDERAVYLLAGGTFDTSSVAGAYSALIAKGIEYAHGVQKAFDFEGSVIPEVTRKIREFGGNAYPYFRIRKVFSPALLAEEYEQAKRSLADE